MPRLGSVSAAVNSTREKSPGPAFRGASSTSHTFASCDRFVRAGTCVRSRSSNTPQPTASPWESASQARLAASVAAQSYFVGRGGAAAGPPA